MGEAVSEMSGVILAAGRGLRLAALPTGMPKCLLPVGNRPLIAYHFDVFRQLRIRRVHIVLGEDAAHLTLRFPSPGSGIEVEFHTQSSPQGIADTLRELRPALDGPFLLFLGDIYLHEPEMSHTALRFLNSDAQCILVAKRNSSPFALSRSFSIQHNERREVTRVEEKPMPIPGQTRGCGAYFFKPAIFDAVEETPVSPLRNELELTDAVQTLIAGGARVMMEEVSRWDYNINTPEDLLECNLDFVRDRGHSLVDPAAALPEGCVVERSIVGAHVTADAPIVIRESVIFAGTHLGASVAIVRSLVLPNAIFPCGDTAA